MAFFVIPAVAALAVALVHGCAVRVLCGVAGIAVTAGWAITHPFEAHVLGFAFGIFLLAILAAISRIQRPSQGSGPGRR
jgi:hypothetical protein